MRGFKSAQKRLSHRSSLFFSRTLDDTYRLSVKNKILQVTLLLIIFLSTIAVAGTNSRGGFAGLAVLLFALFMISKRKYLLSILVAIGMTAFIVLVPTTYFDRVQTITESSQDSSFMGRVVAWKQSTLIAISNPLTGGGFDAVKDPAIWLKYSEIFNKLDFIDSPHPLDYSKPKVAHSIYFNLQIWISP